MNPIGIRFLLSDGQFFQTIMLEESAKKLIKAWMDRQLPFITGDVAPSLSWAIKIDAVKAIHTFDPAELQPQQPMAPAGYAPWLGKSGVN